MIKVILALSAVSLFHLSLSVGRYLSNSIQVTNAQEARTIQDREEQQRAIESIARQIEAQRKADEAFNKRLAEMSKQNIEDMKRNQAEFEKMTREAGLPVYTNQGKR